MGPYNLLQLYYIFIFDYFHIDLSLLNVLFNNFLCVFLVIYLFSFILISQFHFIAKQISFSLAVPVTGSHHLQPD